MPSRPAFPFPHTILKCLDLLSCPPDNSTCCPGGRPPVPQTILYVAQAAGLLSPRQFYMLPRRQASCPPDNSICCPGGRPPVPQTILYVAQAAGLLSPRQFYMLPRPPVPQTILYVAQAAGLLSPRQFYMLPRRQASCPPDNSICCPGGRPPVPQTILYVAQAAGLLSPRQFYMLPRPPVLSPRQFWNVAQTCVSPLTWNAIYDQGPRPSAACGPCPWY